MAYTDTAIDITIALGKGVYSVGEDLVLGLQRTGEGLGLGQDGRMAQIGYENNALYNLLKQFIKYGINNFDSPLYISIVYILEHYYSYFPDAVVSALAKQAGISLSHSVGRMVIGKKLATSTAQRIAASVAASAMYKQLAKRIGISEAASATGVGIPISLLMMQGFLQRSSHAADRLKSKSQNLYSLLQQKGDLQLLYFLIEKPIDIYIDAISMAEKNPHIFNQSLSNKYKDLLEH